MKAFFAILVTAMLGACVVIPPAVDRDADVLVIGDSILAWHRGKGQSIPDVIEDQTQRSVTNQSIAGAPFAGARGIPSQFVDGTWDVVVMNGGGNDIGAVCDGPAVQKAQTLDALISADGRRGPLPDFVRRLQQSGTPVIFVGYYPISVKGGPFLPCRATLDDLKSRQRQMAAGLDGVTFVDTADVIPPDNLALYASDLVHPSVDGAARIGVQIADVLRRIAP
ncbi:SGNH/GDSL hydrolase family protein [Pseudooctadecabacter jejudonensis]|uniref:SGNH hydrolase-type esterase domain-containing protein n=1 Tax=Pseudooctadecabacter jejudonensis TaxID=1391910 RepID=A0A1Y5S0M4_9RHOB|nr:SGNH/GDSL hydrolase family protein [Pseudooctadecabacter jejudonensis]SLN29980.1 hypothetical protein PSJ8397_01352 [Pseudooctadecabacter jejudonensis]